MKSTTSANRMLASSKWSAIEFGSDCSRCAISAGRTLSRSSSTRACAASRPRANVTSNSIATAETTTMLSTSKVRTKPLGRSAPSGRTTSERASESSRVATKAANHGQARFGRSKATAPSGANSAHRITELDSSRPPSMIIPRAGATRIRSSCAVRRNAMLLVRANTARLIAEPAA